MGAIFGSVTLEGQPAGGVYVRLTGPSGEFVSERYTGDDGRFTFHVAPGPWTIEARAAGAETEVRTLEIADGDAQAEIPLRRSG